MESSKELKPGLKAAGDLEPGQIIINRKGKTFYPLFYMLIKIVSFTRPVSVDINPLMAKLKFFQFEI